MQIVVTGFGPYPGQPQNPTEELMRQLAIDLPKLGQDVRLQRLVLPTEYSGLAERLTLIGALGKPDIAIHFGLAPMAKGFRLEEIARNYVATDQIDAAGKCAPFNEIATGVPDRASSLPLARLEAALRAENLPVERSQDCGDYLCNALFFHSCAGLVASFRPAMAGFIHVPLPGAHLNAAQLEAGARLIIAETVAAWRDIKLNS